VLVANQKVDGRQCDKIQKTQQPQSVSTSRDLVEPHGLLSLSEYISSGAVQQNVSPRRADFIKRNAEQKRDSFLKENPGLQVPPDEGPQTLRLMGKIERLYELNPISHCNRVVTAALRSLYRTPLLFG
jgi:hypothetical protein